MAESLDDAELGPEQILALRFRGERIEERGVGLTLFAELLTSIDRLLTGLQPLAAGLRVELGGPLLMAVFGRIASTIPLPCSHGSANSPERHKGAGLIGWQ